MMPTATRRDRTTKATDWLLSQVSLPDDQPCLDKPQDLWTRKYLPESQSDLAIHGDKLKELTKVLQQCFSHSNSKCLGGPVILLTGPSGSGKTSALRISVKSLFPDVQWMEWSDESLMVDEVAQLEEFVMQTGRYSIVTSNIICASHSPPSVIVLKTLPVSLVDCAPRFHSLLRFHATRSSPSCLLAVSFTSSSSARESLLSERILCPASLRVELNISRIEFNPVAPTLLLRALNRIAKLECASNKAPTRAVLQQIANGCSGDLRTAINQLQFFCQSAQKIGRFVHPSGVQPDIGRDPGLSMFRALGKFLYGKRQESESSSVRKSSTSKIHKSGLPPHLITWERPPLAFDLDDVLDQCQMNGDQVVLWLHENYPDFMPHMSAVNWFSHHVSWADAHLFGGMNWRLGLTPAADWNASDSVMSPTRPSPSTASRHYAALAVVRALLLSHDMIEDACGINSKAQRAHVRLGFHPLRAPSFHDAWKVTRQHRDTLLDLCSYAVTPLNGLGPWNQFIMTDRCRWLFDYLPLAAKCQSFRGCSLRNPAVEELVRVISNFGQSVRPGDRRMRAGVDKKPLMEFDPDGICPPDAVAEGDALPIEEDNSDEELKENNHTMPVRI